MIDDEQYTPEQGGFQGFAGPSHEETSSTGDGAEAAGTKKRGPRPGHGRQTRSSIAKSCCKRPRHSIVPTRECVERRCGAIDTLGTDGRGRTIGQSARKTPALI